MRSFKDDSARVPFAVIGVFLILIATIVSINLTRLDINMAKTMSSSLEVTSADKAIRYARADISRAVNYAGMGALKQIGETPVIKPDNNSEYYNGTLGDPEEFSRNWAKAMIRSTIDQYIESNYRNDTFVINEFSVNIEYPGPWEDIIIEPITMKLDRSLEPPLQSPGGGRYGSGYGTYWKISVPLM